MADSKFCAGCQRGDKDTKAVSWCSDCSEQVCKACSRDHDRMSPPHKVVPIKQMQQLCSSLLKLSKNCQNHPDQAISLYCCQHDKVVCVSCVPVSHQNCKSIISNEKAAKGVTDGTAISDLERRLSNLCQVTEKIQSQREITVVDLFQVVKFLDAKTYQKELEIREIKTATVQKLIYNPLKSESNIQKLVPDLGTTTVENVQVQMPLLDIDQQGQFLVKDERKLSLSHSFKTMKLGNEVRIYRECFIPDDRLPLLDNIGTQLFVCTLDGSSCNVIGLDYFPLSNTVYDNTHYVVSVGDRGIQIIDLKSLKPGRIIKLMDPVAESPV